MITKKQKVFILLGIIGVPILINGVMMISTPITIGDYTDWIPFWGNMVGALIAGGITLFVLLKTIEHNKTISDNSIEHNKKENQKALLLNYKKEELLALKQSVVENRNVIDYQNVIEILDLVNVRKYSEVTDGITVLRSKMERQLKNYKLIYKYKLQSEIARKYTLNLFNLCKHILYFAKDIDCINQLRVFMLRENNTLQNIFLFINEYYEVTYLNTSDKEYFKFCNVKVIFELRDKEKFSRIKSLEQFQGGIIDKSLDIILEELTGLVDKNEEVYSNASDFIHEKESEIEELINS